MTVVAKAAAAIYVAAWNLLSDWATILFLVVTLGIVLASRSRMPAGSNPRRDYNLLIMAGPLLAVAALPPLISTPSPKYVIGLSAILLMLWVSWVCTWMARNVGQRRPGRSPTRRWPRPAPARA